MNSPAQSAGVLSFDEAYGIVRAYCRRILEQRPPQAEELPLLQALGRVLASPVLADRDFPPFPRATRDGFAVRAADLQADGPVSLRVVGQVKAGDSYDLPLASGEAVEIMTGAAVPQGADAVVMVEYTARKSTDHKEHLSHSPAPGAGSLRAGLGTPGEKAGEAGTSADSILEDLGSFTGKSAADSETDDWVEIQRPVSAGENVVPAGAEARAGQELLPRGIRLGPAQIAMAAAAGSASIRVARKPRVAILSTGDELVEL